MIDDESDYFSVDGNQWLSSQQRDALRKREDELRKARHGSRLERKITFDFAGRRVVEEENALADYDPSKDEVVKGIMGGGGKKGGGAGGEGPAVSLEARRTLDDTDGAANPFLDWPRPQLVASAEEEQRKRAEPKASNVASSAKFGRRLQDRELQEMGDDGVCLSMHQPYASLLVRKRTSKPLANYIHTLFSPRRFVASRGTRAARGTPPSAAACGSTPPPRCPRKRRWPRSRGSTRTTTRVGKIGENIVTMLYIYETFGVQMTRFRFRPPSPPAACSAASTWWTVFPRYWVSKLFGGGNRSK